MRSDFIKRLFIFLTLGLLTTSAFFIRLENVKAAKKWSIDEIVYYRMGLQMKDDFFNYNTLPYAHDLMSQGRELPAYFTKPLFKYPPFFTMMVAASLNFFDESFISGIYVAILSGALLIPLTYLLGKIIFNRMVGVLSAILMFFDPVTIICSQKLWMETSLVFFSLLSVYFFILSIEHHKKRLYILSGICCGLAASIKYPGIFFVPIYVAYAFFWRRELLKCREFWLGQIMPFVMLIPWAVWNAEVYGVSGAVTQLLFHSTRKHAMETLLKLALVLLILSGIYLYFKNKKYSLRQIMAVINDYLSSQRFKKVIIIAFFLMLLPYFVRAIGFGHLPRVGWQMMMFYYEPPTFYFGQLLEFSLIFAFGYVALLLKEAGDHPGRTIAKLIVWFNMAFYSLWGNYQSRYVLVCIPLLLIFASHILFICFARIKKDPTQLQSKLQFAGIILFLGYAFIKTQFVNEIISYPNDLCFF